MAAINKDDVVKKGLFDNAGDSADKNKPKVDSLTESIKKLNQEVAKATKDALGVVKPKDIKSIEELNLLTAKANQTAKNRLEINKQIQKDQIKIQEQRKANNKELRNEIVLENKQAGTLEKLAVVSKKLRAEREGLNLTTKKGQQRLRQINRELNRNNKFIERNSDKLKQQRLGIGKYSKALNGLRGGLAKLGVSFGAAFALRGSINILKEFDEASADMAKTLNITHEAAKALSMELLDIDTRTSLEELQKIAAIGGQMGIAQGDIIEFTESIDKLNVALGDEFTGGAEEITKEIGGLRNVLTDFKTDDAAGDILKIGNALNVLGAAGNATSPVVTDFAKRISGVGVPLGLTTAQILGTSTALQELGVNSEKGGTAVGKILQKMTTNSEQFAKLAGVPLDEFNKLLNEDMFGAFQKVLKGTQKFKGDSVGLGKQLESLGLTGSGASEVFLKLGGNIDLMTEKTNLSAEALENTDSVMAEFNTKNDTLSATIEKAVNKIKAQVLAFNESSGAASKLKNAIQFLTENMGTIISVLSKLVIGFVAFKTAMLSLKLAERTKEFFEHGKAIKLSGDNAKKASGGVKAFGQALKSIGFALAISFIIEMTQEFIRLTSGMAQATIQAEEFAKATEKAGESVDNFNKVNNTALQDQINGIREKNLSQKEETRLINEATIAANKRTAARIADLRAAKIETLALLERAKAEQERLKEQKGLGLFDFSGEDSIALGKANLAVIKLNANERNLSTQILALKESQAGLNQTIIDGEIDLSRMGKTVNSNTEDVDNNTKAIERNNFARLERNEFETPEGADKIIESLDALHEADMQRKIDVADIRVLQEEINGDEEAILEARINRINVQLELDKAASESGAERYRLELQSQLDIEDLVLESQQRVADEEARILAERAQQQNEYIKSLEQGWVKALDARIALFNDEQKAAEKQADFFIKQSDKGDIEAEQSITAARERARQAEEEAKKAEKQKQIALMVSAFLQAFNNALGEGKNVGQALGEAATGVAASSALIPSIIAAVPTFLEGTENTGSHGEGIDGKGGFHAILHPNEGVATKEVNMKKEKAGLTLGGAVDKAIAYDNLINRDFTNGLTDGNQVAPGWDNHLLVDQMLKVQDEVKNLTKVMEGKSDTSIGEVTKHTMAILNKSKKGGNKTTSVFVVKK